MYGGEPIHCYTMLLFMESGVLFHRLFVYSGEHNILLHRVGIYGVWHALLKTCSVTQ